MIDKLSLIGLKIFKFVASAIIIVMVGISSYNIADMWSTEHAFSSLDLNQYRPQIESGETSLEAIEKVAKDVRSWIIIYDTHIDYPVAQGKDNLEYVNKDVFGDSAPTGAIYLASENEPDYSDSYNLLYGHHVSSGAMFGDITNFKDEDYLKEHKKGVLITDDVVYDLDIFACLDTYAYDKTIYRPGDVDLKSFLSYIKSFALVYESPGKPAKIIGLSTCDDERSNGRTVVFAKMTEHEGEFEQYPSKTGRDLFPRGHRENYWAFLNLICLICTFYLAIPLHILRSKFRRSKTMKDINELEAEQTKLLMPDAENEDRYIIKKFRRRVSITETGEIIIAILALILFLLTEDIHTPIRMIDCYTPIHLILLIGAWLLDRLFVRIKDKDENKDADLEQGAEG